jgi:O-methyltransferase
MAQSIARATLRSLFSKLGYTVSRTPKSGEVAWPDLDEETIALFRGVAPFTMTSVERVSALHESIKYIVRHNIPGSFVECGVWKGGSMMAAARTLMRLGTERDLYLFDTFQGMPPPTSFDADLHGIPADILLKTNPLTTAIAPFEEVSRNMFSTGYDRIHIKFVRGKVEDTIPDQAPGEIAFLRLDTDWYESTKHELVHLFPRLAKGGILIIDDYGHFIGAKKAVDEYFLELGVPVFLNRIDYTGRLAVKPF